jgi:HSP20 family protein
MVEDTITWIPPMDVYENGDSYIFYAELPGVDLEDIHVECSAGKVTIFGERLFSMDCANENYQRLEGQRGKFQRTFSLFEAVDPDRVQLGLENGLLHVVIPKAAGGKRRAPRHGR